MKLKYIYIHFFVDRIIFILLNKFEFEFSCFISLVYQGKSLPIQMNLSTIAAVFERIIIPVRYIFTLKIIDKNMINILNNI